MDKLNGINIQIVIHSHANLKNVRNNYFLLIRKMPLTITTVVIM